MKDNAIKWLTELNPFDKVKGHTKIELTDVKTGKKQIIEKDNAFQAGVLASYMRSMGAYNNNPYANSTWADQPIWRNLCGGLLLFKDEIDNSNDEVEYMPAGNQMVGNGAFGVVNNGTPTEMGSYNSTESQTSGNDSVTFVYDFTTSQANGTISCVCLTTEVGGYIGYGNPSGEAASSSRAFGMNQSSRSNSKIVYNNYEWDFSVNNTDKLVTVTKTPLEITKGSIFDNIAEDSFTISYTGSVSDSFIRAVYIGNGKAALICLPNSSQYTGIGNGATFSPLIIVDLVNSTASVKTITNNSGEQLALRFFSGWGIVGVDEQYLYMVGYNSPFKMYAIDYTDGQSTTKDLGFNGNNEQRDILKCGLITPELFYGFGRIWDKENDTVYPVNGAGTYWQYNDDLDAIVGNNTSGIAGWGGFFICKNPLILATINNLDTPVTKTAAQTMKITYTLSKASE